MSRAPRDLVNSRKSDDGMTALHLACQHGFREIAGLLIEQVQPHCSLSVTMTQPLFDTCTAFPLPSNRQHLSSGDCLEGKRGDYLTSSVLLCIIIVHIICTPI